MEYQYNFKCNQCASHYCQHILNSRIPWDKEVLLNMATWLSTTFCTQLTVIGVVCKWELVE